MMRVKKTVFYLLALFVALPSVATAGRVIQVSVSHDDGVYSLLVEMEIQADASSRWYSPEPQVVVGRIEIRDCVLFFCATLVQVQKIRELPSGDLQVTILPHLSDYSMGKSLWHIVQQADGSTRHGSKTLGSSLDWPCYGFQFVKRTGFEYDGKPRNIDSAPSIIRSIG